MSRTKSHIKRQTNTISEVLYAINEKPTTTASLSEEIMEGNAKAKSIRQTSTVIYAQSKVAENTETKRKEKKESPVETMENASTCLSPTYVE